MKLEFITFDFDKFASEMANLKEKKGFDYLITIVGVQGIFLGLTGLLFKGTERIIPYAILISIVILWLCYLVHLAIGPLYTPKKK